MFSHDGAQSWQKYENNPVLPLVASGSRDPAVIWNPEFQQWMMVLYIGKNKERENNNQHFALFRSKNLKEWERIQDLFFPGTGECGECFPIALDEDVEQIRWVFWTADGYYLIGKFDGNKFIPETEILKSTYSAVRCEKSIGLNFRGGYAAQTWNDIPPEDGRRIQIAWLADDIPDMPFNQQMTFPVELTLLSTENGPRLRSWPVKEIELLYQQKRVIQNIELSDTPTILPTDEHDLLDILIEIEVEDKSEFELNLRGISLIYDAEKQKLSCLDRTTYLKPVAGKIKLRVLLDRASVEIYAADGLVYIPISVVPNESEKSCFVYFPRGKGAVKELHIFKLNSSWAN
jgi:sucrose-6-phosphate hydrolase SacC (GH32 family)